MTGKSQAFRRNHYVPVWYQKRFLLPGKYKYFRLDLSPEIVKKMALSFLGIIFMNGLRKKFSPKKIFIQQNGGA